MMTRNPLRMVAGWLLGFGVIALCVSGRPCYAEGTEALGKGDSVRVTVFQNPDLTTETRIANNGKITMPLIGEVSLAGLTPATAASRIATQLKDGNYLRNPQVTVSVIQLRSRQVSVLGQVVHPGRYALDDTSSHLADILALAGGIAPTGDDLATIIVTRDGKPKKLVVDVPRMYRNADLSNNVEIQPGDTIYVQRAPQFYIYGEVQHAGAYRLEPNMIVMQALSVGGGVTARGTDSGIKIHRRSADGKLSKLDAKLTDPVQPDDVIYVRESWF